jgi:hypothetical protein
MSNFLPSPPAGKRPGVPASSAIAVNPAALASVPAGLLQRAQLLRAGVPALFSAWEQAAAALAEQRTGAVLASSRPGCAAALEDCAVTVEALASSLRWGAMAYSNAELAAAAGVPTGDRAQAWMP